MSCRFQGPLKHIKQHFPLVLIRSKAKHYQPRLLLLGNVKIQIIHQGRFNLANSKKMALWVREAGSEDIIQWLNWLFLYIMFLSEFSSIILNPQNILQSWETTKNPFCYYYLATTCWPPGDHLVTAWWPLGDHLVTTFFIFFYCEICFRTYGIHPNILIETSNV